MLLRFASGEDYGPLAARLTAATRLMASNMMKRLEYEPKRFSSYRRLIFSRLILFSYSTKSC